jgi:hypothetical protein
MITDTQRINIRNLSIDDSLEVMQIIASAKAIVTKRQYSEITAVPLRTVYENIDKGRVKYFEIDGVKFPCINT